MAQMDNEAKGLMLAINEVLKRNVATATEEVISKAVQDFEKRLRSEVAKAAMDVSSHYDLYRNGSNLVITVKHIKPENQGQT